MNLLSDELSSNINHRVYSLNEINDIKFNKEKITPIKKKSIGQKAKLGLDFIIKYGVYVSGSILAWFAISSMTYSIMTAQKVLTVDFKSGLIGAAMVAVIALVINKKTQLKYRIRIQFKDNKVYDMVVINSDISFVKKYINSLISKFCFN
ncbi:MAG: hypothetical protein ACRC2K_01480 [Clostridium sp.]